MRATTRCVHEDRSASQSTARTSLVFVHHRPSSRRSNLHRNRHPHPREPFPTQETNSGSQRGSSRQNGGTAGSNSNRHADGSRDWAASECVGRNPFSAGGDVDVDAAGSGPGRMSRGNNRGSLNGRSGMITDEERGWRSSARPDDDDIESDWSRTQRDSRPLSDVQSAGPDLSSVGGREGEERWAADKMGE